MTKEEYKVKLVMNSPDVKVIEEGIETFEELDIVVSQWMWMCDDGIIEVFRKKNDTYICVKKIVINKNF